MTWNQLSTKQRCAVISAVAAEISGRTTDLIDCCRSDQRTDPVETITGELLPLCAGLKFVGRKGARILSPRTVGVWGRPAWLIGIHATVTRAPLGDVLILGTWNYPLLLPGIQIAQALAGGNRVLMKPAVSTETATRTLAECFYAAGVPVEQLQILDSSTDAAVQAIRSGVDLIVLTGAAETGRKVMAEAAKTLTPSIMELSGCDAVIALRGCDLARLTKAIEFGLLFNAGATCIGPRRLIVHEQDHHQVTTALTAALGSHQTCIVHPAARQQVSRLIKETLSDGAKDLLGNYNETELLETGTTRPIVLDAVRDSHPIAAADLFAPVISVMKVDQMQQAVEMVNRCPYRLAASVFGPTQEARHIAAQLNVGTVTINDLIVPTADPRLPFGGRGQSGFSVTRGREGLLAMTAPKVIATRKGSIAPHLSPRSQADSELLEGVLRTTYSRGIRKRLDGLWQTIRAGKESRKSP